MDINYLHQQLATVLSANFVGVGVPDPANKTTWRVDYLAGYTPTATEQAAAQAVIANFDPANSINPLTIYANQLTVGATVTSAANSAINGTYGLTEEYLIKMTALQDSINAGVTWLGYCRDINFVQKTMTAAQFTILASTILGYLATLDTWLTMALGGTVNPMPSNQLTIS